MAVYLVDLSTGGQMPKRHLVGTVTVIAILLGVAVIVELTHGSFYTATAHTRLMVMTGAIVLAVLMFAAIMAGLVVYMVKEFRAVEVSTIKRCDDLLAEALVILARLEEKLAAGGNDLTLQIELQDKITRLLLEQGKALEIDPRLCSPEYLDAVRQLIEHQRRLVH